MLPGNRIKANVGVGIEMALFAAGFVWNLRGYETVTGYGLELMLLSALPFTWGCMHYAEGKGHSKWVGLVGIAGIIGLIILVILPDLRRSNQ